MTDTCANCEKWKLQSDDWQKRGWELGHENDRLRVAALAQPPVAETGGEG